MEAISEQYGGAALALANAARHQLYRSVIFSSPTGGEGTSSAVLRTGRYMKSRLSLKPLLIELNRLRPSWCSQFDLDPSKSLAAMAAGRASARQCVQHDRRGLSLIPVGDFAPADGSWQPLETVLCRAVQELEEDFDIILVDAPPLLECTDALVAGQVIPRMVLVVRSGRVSREVLDRVRHELGIARIEIVGSILNRQEQIVPRWLSRWLRP